ncbi:hypothetical protein EMIHUDRAFT_77352 [Emiliania huxleyi CCMP1516]|uniref:Alpha-galactosidase n=2 Tax=Emiliania huxleyi TaxID=2903 RepID=A0A0D3I4P9_EMIH1|nr:hypothetical protein EMIHUDRAFT_77352 [Emiliania huxleyi CCMP1516]EOD06234.1 hypothetical protein EMIHUDRAFT_77352 [Emiliania huxleyi CCMP1516]|eukprot:XP_005758663.1 hypothetical protein EMIHUDRAFT_77352 [Emiliania huxleyi CCMP1516]
MAALAAALATAVSAYNNGMGERPPMGWQTWCSVGECGEDHCFDGQIRAMADTLVLSGMKDLGYDWVVLDDCWHPTRDNATAELVPYPRFFPDGMKPVIDYVHSLGLKFGLYTSVGDRTCHGGWSPGSFGHYERDARTFAAWGVDYVKIDYCGSHDSVEGHRNMSRALNATGRPMSYMLCRGPYQQQDHWGYAPGIAQGWRATGDHHDNFASVRQQVEAVRGKASWSGPFGWAYLDMMMTGGQGCKDHEEEYRTEASLYVVVSSPLMVGTDIRLMTPIMKLLLNKEAIAINQDYKAVPGDAMPSCHGSSQEAWVRRLSNGDSAVALTNWGNHTASLAVCLDAIGWTHGETAGARNVWARQSLGTFSRRFEAKVRAHDTLLLLLSRTGAAGSPENKVAVAM